MYVLISYLWKNGVLLVDPNTNNKTNFSKIQSKKMTVLVIDNSTLFHEILMSIFSNIDMTPSFFDNAVQGLEELKTQKYDCICLSMHMEDSDGISFTKTIRTLKNHQHTPIFLLTSDESNEVYQQALACGVTEVFNKQDVVQLINFIQRFTLQQQAMSGRVLYIEDTLSQQHLITKMFTDKGLTVDAFSSAEEAWHSYIHNDYDLVVTDIILKGQMTGMALTNRIRRLGGDKGDIPILAITAFDDISRRIELFYLGVSDYVIKPIIEEELIARVRNLIKGKQLYAESLKQKSLAEAADIAKSEFISHMNRELRTPVNAILGFSSLLMKDASKNLKGHEKTNKSNSEHSLKVINDITEHLLKLINDVTNISKIEAGIIDINIKDVFLSNLVDSSVNKLLPIAKQHNIEIEPYSIPNSLQVKADPLRLHQVLINLLSNSIKYNNEYGSIQILCKSLDSGFIKLGVKDTGVGLTQTEQENLFKPFNHVEHDQDVEYSGLGLVVSNRFMHLMNGKIDLKSKKGQGSTFWIELPTSSSHTTH